jgi:alpha-L-fucosidase 2
MNKVTSLFSAALLLVLVVGVAIGWATPQKDQPAEPLDNYNVVWTTPSENAHGSMPLGNGDIGINAWVEDSGDLVFYVSKTDAWDENARLCKIGRVRVKFDLPLTPKDGFRQELKLRDGVIEIAAKIQNQAAKILLWVDADQPVVRVEVESAAAVSCRAEVELWRLRERPLVPQEDYGYGDGKSPQAQAYKLTVLPDVVVTSVAPQVIWYHRNTRSLYPVCLEVQHLEALKGKFADPLLNHAFGASLRGADMVRDGAKALKSAKPAKRHQLSVCVLAERAETADAWLKDLDRAERAALRPGFDQARRTTATWWQAFWNRSWVFVGGDAGSANGNAAAKSGAATAAPPELTQGYVLQRFMNACSGRGGSPIKFNGSIFTVEKVPGTSPETEDGDPDWRNWGGSYWFQNTRLAYWPMLATGDFEMMEPWFRMYREALPLSKARMKAIYKFVDAASFQETMNFWGMPNNRDYGWSHNGPEPGNVCIHRYWSGGMELTAFMLDRYDFTQDQDFVRNTLVPLADPIIAFFDQYWQKRDANGKIIFDPAQSLEALPWTVNPMPEIAGLRFILPRLLALPKNITTEAQRSRWARILQELPPVPVAEVNGVKLLRPSGKFTGGDYSENPELYAVFPYRLYGVGKPDLGMARATYDKRVNRHNFGWCQDSIQAACLGLGDEAGWQVAARARNINGGYRFPAMWRGFDWIPDQDHGDNILTTLQCMLLQSDGRKLYVLPAWPKNWNVAFKLHAPYNTTVEGVFKAGKLEQLKVTPESRAKDVIRMDQESRPNMP